MYTGFDDPPGDGRDHGDLAEALDYIDPARLSYQEWVDVGMALHESGLDVSLWDGWSRRDPGRYHPGECERKWAGFGRGAGDRVRSGTVAAMAREAGWVPGGADAAFSWDDVVSLADRSPARPDPAWAQDEDPSREAPAEGDAAAARASMAMLGRYLEALFDDGDYVAYSVESFCPEGSDRKVPTRGVYTRTAGELRQALAKWSSAEGDLCSIESVVGDYDHGVGGWIRFNPFDGKGVRNDNVTEYRYALVESDELPYEKQLPMIREMNLPCAAVVTSGGKSVHAVVRIDAGTDFALYRRRVEELYAYCRRCGFAPDTQNKNPSRLSRMPGLVRGGQLQALVDTACGAASWDEWCAWRAENEDDLPDDVSDDWDDPIELAPALIGQGERGILRQGQKMVLAGPSKAGKSYALIDLAEAIACGGTWWGYPCAEGPVYYVNLEIADASFRDRQHRVWADREECGQCGSGLVSVKRNFVRLDLRGHAADMEKLGPRIVHRVLRRGPKGTFKAVIVDPIYKVNGGDENDAAAISRFTNQLDRLASECGCAVIYAHHHAKGALGDRRSIDRMSGSGVFARDADAIVDMCQLYVPEGSEAEAALSGATAWRVTATLREFRSPEPFDLVWRYPRFLPDASGALRALDVDGTANIQRINDRKRVSAKERRGAIVEAMGRAVEGARADGVTPTRAEVARRMGEDAAFGQRVTAENVKSWTVARAEWSPFRAAGADEHFALYDTRSSDPFGVGTDVEYELPAGG